METAKGEVSLREHIKFIPNDNKIFFLKHKMVDLGMVVHAFDPSSTHVAEVGGFLTSLSYRASSRTASATQKNPVLRWKNARWDKFTST